MLTNLCPEESHAGLAMPSHTDGLLVGRFIYPEAILFLLELLKLVTEKSQREFENSRL